ncbi:MAG TPA: hypothetical protein VI548_11565 [Chitinophagaceae bacterium]|nr:hypothetical protein [Chitinophagaceae bacterium]
MEVHAHTHTPRKKWTHYFWEFLMLFLAVFCGFLAEYQLEHKIEKDRAKVLAINFYDELKGDSAAVQWAIHRRQKKDSSIQYLADYFQDNGITNLSKDFTLNYTIALLINSPILFEPRNSILEQLKNSGSLRYFKSKELQILTGDILVAIANLKARHEIEQNYYEQWIGPFLNRHNDHLWFKEIRGKGNSTLLKNIEDYQNSPDEISFHFNNPEQYNKNETLNMLQLYLIIIQTTRVNQYKKYIALNRKLLEELRKQYHLK